MSDNVLSYEPHEALFVADHEALIFYIAIAKWAWNSLKPNGRLFFEINEIYASQILLILDEFGYIEGQVKKDIYDKPRMITALKGLV